MPRSTRNFAAAAIALIGVAGEIAFLRHELVDSYPYKMMTFPPSQFYRAIGNTGSIVIFLAAVIVAIALLPRKPFLATSLLPSAVPLTYLLVMVIATSIIYGWQLPPGRENFDGYAITQVTGGFAVLAVVLAISGLAVGGLCAGVLRRAAR
jgi:hypothetical protein